MFDSEKCASMIVTDKTLNAQCLLEYHLQACAAIPFRSRIVDGTERNPLHLHDSHADRSATISHLEC